MTLFKILNDTYYKHNAEGFKFVSFKTDFLAERSIPDNIELEAS
jgi:hypothetical protein